MFEYSLGKTKSQLVLKHAKVMNVFSNEWIEQDIAIQYGTIVGVGAYEGETEIDLTGKYVVPGFIDAHMHIESTLVAPEELSKVLLAQGTTTILSDPHELVNVKGAEALDYVLQAGRNTTLDIYTMLPSSVPCFDKDTNGAGEFTAAQMSAYIDDPNVIGLGEVMRVKDVVLEEEKMVEKLDLFKDKPIDGHAPNVSGKELEAYRFADILTDHESSTYEEALDKLRCGFYVLIREGSQAKNLEQSSRVSGARHSVYPHRLLYRRPASGRHFERGTHFALHSKSDRAGRRRVYRLQNGDATSGDHLRTASQRRRGGGLPGGSGRFKRSQNRGDRLRVQKRPQSDAQTFKGDRAERGFAALRLSFRRY